MRATSPFNSLLKGFLYMTKYAIGVVPHPGDLTIAVGNTVYTVRGFFKPTGKTLSEKLLRNMEKELEISGAVCYNKDDKSQKGLDCKRERSAG
jgi:hypothetical protein